MHVDTLLLGSHLVLFVLVVYRSVSQQPWGARGGWRQLAETSSTSAAAGTSSVYVSKSQQSGGWSIGVAVILSVSVCADGVQVSQQACAGGGGSAPAQRLAALRPPADTGSSHCWCSVSRGSAVACAEAALVVSSRSSYQLRGTTVGSQTAPYQPPSKHWRYTCTQGCIGVDASSVSYTRSGSGIT